MEQLQGTNPIIIYQKNSIITINNQYFVHCRRNMAKSTIVSKTNSVWPFISSWKKLLLITTNLPKPDSLHTNCRSTAWLTPSMTNYQRELTFCHHHRLLYLSLASLHHTQNHWAIHTLIHKHSDSLEVQILDFINQGWLWNLKHVDQALIWQRWIRIILHEHFVCNILQILNVPKCCSISKNI